MSELGVVHFKMEDWINGGMLVVTFISLGTKMMVIALPVHDLILFTASSKGFHPSFSKNIIKIVSIIWEQRKLYINNILCYGLSLDVPPNLNVAMCETF